jgi:hypothetical protein
MQDRGYELRRISLSRHLGEYVPELHFSGVRWSFLEGRAGYYSFLCALHYSGQFVLLWLGHFEFIQRCLKVIPECHPLLVGDHQMPVRVAHWTTGIRLWAASRLTDHLRQEKLESWR